MQGIAGLFDPPYALSSGNGLVAFATTTAAEPVAAPATTTSGAAAGPKIAPVTPSATKAAISVNPATTVNSDPPAQTPYNDPPANSPSPAYNDLPAQVPSSDPLATSPSNDLPPQSPTAAFVDPPPAVVTIGSSTITANSASEFSIASQTLKPGGQITHSGTVLSLDPSGSALIIGGSTTEILSHATTTSVEFLVGSQTLQPGGLAVTVSGTAYSLLSGGSSVAVDGTVQPLTALLTTPEYVVAYQTLVPGGPAITVSGTVVSLQTGGSRVVVGGKTEALSDFLGPSMTEVGLGGIIATIGGFETTTSVSSSSNLQVSVSGGYNGTMFLGGTERSRQRRNGWLLGLMVGVGLVGAW